MKLILNILLNKIRIELNIFNILLLAIMIVRYP